jgi:prepilin-type N-terminal cleavage/methylation domain-containing protein
MMKSHAQAGFSAVELLVTLFVAVIFLAAGNMFYSTIVQDSGSARQQARASNVAYDYLRRYAAQTPATCAASTPVNNVAPNPVPDGLANVTVKVTYSCPDSTLPNMTKVQAEVTYGSDAQKVVHALYATR